MRCALAVPGRLACSPSPAALRTRQLAVRRLSTKPAQRASTAIRRSATSRVDIRAASAGGQLDPSASEPQSSAPPALPEGPTGGQAPSLLMLVVIAVLAGAVLAGVIALAGGGGFLLRSWQLIKAAIAHPCAMPVIGLTGIVLDYIQLRRFSRLNSTLQRK